jgi:transcription elongation factor GreB
MSKAFTREDDDIPERPSVPRAASALPPGAKNYFTEDGARRLRDELRGLSETEKPRLASRPPDDRDAADELSRINTRILQLEEILATAVVVAPPGPPWELVRFGATVAVRDRAGGETRYRIVGVDETDIDRDWISWQSPIARALLNKRVGEKVRLRFPAGEREVEVREIVYEKF